MMSAPWTMCSTRRFGGTSYQWSFALPRLVAASIERYRAAVAELDQAAQAGITTLADRLGAARRGR